MKVTESAVKHPVTTIMIIIGLFIMGIVSLARLGLELFPDITLPTVAIFTVYPGVGPFEVESEVTIPLEDALGALNGVERISSTSGEGVSMVTVSFTQGMDLDQVVPDIREKLDSVDDDLPESSHRPGIYRFNPENLAVFSFNLSARTKGIDPREVAEELIRPELEKIEGIAQVGISGGRELAVMVKLDLEEIGKLEIPITRIIQVFQGENVSLPGGSVNVDGEYVTLRTIGEFTSLQDIEDVLIGYKGTAPISLGDVAEVEIDHIEQETIVRAEGNDGVMVSIKKQPGHNTVNVNDEIKERLAYIRELLPPSVTLEIQTDQSLSVVRSVGGVMNAAWQGGILAIFVLLLFLRNIRSTLIISVVIPVSVIATFTLMDFGGLSMNIISLMGITLGIGMFVDNAIVVLESVYRKQLSGADPYTAAVDGTAEVGRAITASTLTTVVVFLPLVFVEGLAGVIFKDLALTISFALLVSLGGALSLIPVMCRQFIRLDPKKITVKRDDNEHHEISLADIELNTGNRVADRIGKGIQNILSVMDSYYERMITWALNHTAVIFSGAVILLALSVGSIFLMGMEFFPEADEGTFSISLETKIGSTYQFTEGKTEEMEEIINNVLGDDLVSISSIIGEGGSLTESASTGSNLALIQLTLSDKDLRERSIWEIINILDDRFSRELLDVKYKIAIEGISSMATIASGDSSPIVIELYGDNLDVLYAHSRRVEELLKGVDGVRNVRISHRAGRPEMQFVINRQEALSLGISPLEIGATIRTAFKGYEVTTYQNEEDEYPVVLILKEDDRTDVDRFGNLFFVNQRGTKILLDNVVDMVTGRGPLLINRQKGTRMIKVTGSLTGTQPLNLVTGEVRRKLDELGPPPVGVTMDVTGASKEMEESFRSLGFALSLAMILVYMVMASQFESLLHPLIVMFSVPFAAIGMVIALILTGTTFSIIAFIGAILLVGIVVNNAIVLIDYMNTLQKRGVPLRDAIIKGGRTRLKPILMTSTTTILGLVPMSLGYGVGSELRAPMGRAVIGGLLTSTVITLILVPCIYWVFERFARRIKQKIAVSKK